YRKHPLVPINPVNPIYINDLKQSHMVVGSPSAAHLAGAKIANHWAEAKMAIPTNHDLLYRPALSGSASIDGNHPLNRTD
ncbi:MAG: hypothetical protein WD407_13230, partial [Rhodospirillales bacterium]